MKADTLARLEKEAKQPAGVAPVIDSPELAEVLAERRDALDGLEDLLAFARHLASCASVGECSCGFVRTLERVDFVFKTQVTP